MSCKSRELGDRIKIFTPHWWYRLQRLYGFHPYKDSVFDLMHLLCLNLTRHFVDRCWYDTSKSGARSSNSTDPSSKEQKKGIPGGFNRTVFLEQLRSFPWSPEDKRGRPPSAERCSNQYIGYWKGAWSLRVCDAVLSHPICMSVLTCILFFSGGDAEAHVARRSLCFQRGRVQSDLLRYRHPVGAHDRARIRAIST